MSAARLPSFRREADSPAAPEGTGIALRIRPVPDGQPVIARGTYRVRGADRATLGPQSLRRQLFPVAIQRATREAWIGRPGGDAVVFADEEPAGGEVQGWFSVDLAACCGMDEDAEGRFDVTAVLGPFKSLPVEAERWLE